MHTSGLLIGYFEPLHLGHIRSILYASGFVETLHIVITRHPNPNKQFTVTLQDKARWLQMACQDLPFIKIHICDDFSFPVHDSLKALENIAHELDIYNAKINYILDKFNIHKDSALFVTESHPLAREAVSSALTIDVMTTPLHKEFDSAAIHYQPIANWEIIHPQARGDYTRTVAIVGDNSSGKTTLAHKLANYYGARLVLDTTKQYINSNLGGQETNLQYNDYASIATKHAQTVRTAVYKAPAPVTIIDTDFVSIQALCEQYENRTHPFITACIEQLRFDHTIVLASNTLSNHDNEHQQFKNQLNTLYKHHDIAAYLINTSNYFDSYEHAIKYIDAHIFTHNS